MAILAATAALIALARPTGIRREVPIVLLQAKVATFEFADPLEPLTGVAVAPPAMRPDSVRRFTGGFFG